MKPMGWRFVVVSDVPAKSGDLIRISAGDPSAWLGALGLRLTEPSAIELGDEKAFGPEGLDAAVLSHPSFRKAEAVYRGLKLLMADAGDAVQVDFLAAPVKELEARFREKVFDPEMKELKNPPLSLIVLDYEFSHRGADLAALAEMADMAKVVQAPLVAAAAPEFFGLKQLNLLTKIPDLSQRLQDPAHGGWQRLQKNEAARWIVLTVNRYLLRAPADQEKIDPAKPDSYAWGRGPWLQSAAVARSIREQGHALDVSGHKAGRFTGLPTRAYPKLANQTAPLATEIEVPEQFSLELSRAGFVTLSGQTNNDSVLIPIAVNAHRSTPGRLTVSGTLGYQMMAGRLAQFCALLLDELPGSGDAIGAVRKALLEFLGKLAGDKPEEAVKVEAAEGKDGEGKTLPLADITVAPAVKLEDMEFSYRFQLPLPTA